MTEAELSQIDKFELTESNLETEPTLVESVFDCSEFSVDVCEAPTPSLIYTLKCWFTFGAGWRLLWFHMLVHVLFRLSSTI
jgi:hypothetical protein